MLRQRVATAIVLLALLALALWLGPTAFVLAAAVMIGAAFFEWLRLAGHSQRISVLGGLLFGSVLAALELAGVRPTVTLDAVLAALACSIWLVVTGLLVRAHRHLVPLPKPLVTVLAVVLLGVAWLALLTLYRVNVLLLLSVMAMVWVADIAAYFSGRAFGKRKLAPQISPGKTWAGVWGAMLAVIVLAEGLALAWPALGLFTTRLAQHASLVVLLLVVVVLVALSIVGDLFESLLKRQAGRKDSSGLLPGHGGVLDRIDAQLPVLPAAAFVMYWIG
jgi:phosphatidate cytidylyltransferase